MASLSRRGAAFSQFTLDKIYKAAAGGRHTKIVATMGPSTENTEVLRNLVDSGLNVFRLNFSHGDHPSKLEMVNLVRSVNRRTRPYGLPILMDLKGPSVRTGFLKDGHAVTLKSGQKLTLTTDYDFVGSAEKVAISYTKLEKTVNRGDTIYVADGNLTLRVVEVDVAHRLVETVVCNDFVLGERKNVNLPGKTIDIPTLTEKDKHDIREFTLPHGIDMISISFCRSAHDVAEARALLGEAGKSVKIIAKIENHDGLNNLGQILDAVDGLMIARGDLGMEIPPEKLPIAQKWILEQGRLHRKPIITATQMLESMTGAARPTRAETTDVFNAVLEGTHCVMLSGETSAGRFPVQAVDTQRRIVTEAEDCIDYRRELASAQANTPVEALLLAAARMSVEISAQMIVVIAENPRHAQLASFFPSPAFVMAPQSDERELRFFEMFWGIYGVKCPPNAAAEEKVRHSRQAAESFGLLHAGHEPTTIVVDVDEMTCKVLSHY